ncbi:MAG: pantetheine-phosphate adenylyltransferase [Myxococcota bacterium]
MDHRHAVYAGSFDPVTLGHTSIIERAAKLFDRVTVAIGHNPAKKRSGLFSVDERKTLLEQSVDGASHVTVQPFQGLLIDFCRKMNAGVIIRGLRVLTDFEYELQLGMANRDLAPEIETVFLFTRSEHVYVSSSLVKEIAMNGGDTSLYVSQHVREALIDKFSPAEPA